MQTSHKLTLKQAILINILRGMYFVFGAWMSPSDPRHAEIHELLDHADRITEDYPAIIARHVRHLDPAAQALVLQCVENLEIEAKEETDERSN